MSDIAIIVSLLGSLVLDSRVIHPGDSIILVVGNNNIISVNRRLQEP